MEEHRTLLRLVASSRLMVEEFAGYLDEGRTVSGLVSDNSAILAGINLERDVARKANPSFQGTLREKAAQRP